MIGFELLDAVPSAGGARFELLVPADSPYFAGHFPGEPILPAVAQLALAEALATELLGVPAALAAIERIRFRAPIVPGDRLTLELLGGGGAFGAAPASSAPFALQMAVQREGVLVTAGRLSFAPRGSSWRAALETAERDPDPRPQQDRSRAPSLGSAIGALPHAEPALLIERVLEHGETSSRCLARIPPASPFLHAGPHAPALLALEMGAQAAAATEPHGPPAGPQDSRPRGGFLVSARRVFLHATTLPLAGTYHVRADLVSAAPPLRSHAIAIHLDGSLLAACELGTFAR